MLIDTDKVVCKAEIAELACVSPSAVSNYIARHATFPRPIIELRIGALYDLAEVTAWLSSRDKSSRERTERQIQLAEERIERLRRRLA